MQPAEKQLAATTTELASSSSPLLRRLLPIVGVLLAIVLLLLVLAVVAVLVMRNRGSNGAMAAPNANARSSVKSHASSFNNVSSLEEEMMMPLPLPPPPNMDSAATVESGASPDVIPLKAGKFN